MSYENSNQVPGTDAARKSTLNDLLYVYSGRCRQCEVGLPTGLKDDAGNRLRTGDIVMSYTVDSFGVANFDGLTVVIADQWQTYSDGSHVLQEDKATPFVMGIKNVDLELETGVYPDHVWRVRRLKAYEDVVDGEHWKDFGFSFKSI